MYYLVFDNYRYFIIHPRKGVTKAYFDVNKLLNINKLEFSKVDSFIDIDSYINDLCVFKSRNSLEFINLKTLIRNYLYDYSTFIRIF